MIMQKSEELQKRKREGGKKKKKRKTDNGGGPSGESRNTPFLDEGVQKCTDYRRMEG